MKLSRLMLVIVTLILILPGMSVSSHSGVQIQFAHLSPSAPTVDVYIGDKLAVQGLAYQQVSAPISVETAEVTIQIVPTTNMLMDGLFPQPITVTTDAHKSENMVIALVGSATENTLGLVSLAGELRVVNPTVGEAISGNIKVSGAYARPTAKQADSMSGMATPEATETPMAGMGDNGGMNMDKPNSAIYMLIENVGSTPDKLISVSCDDAEMTQVHQTVVENEVAKMQEITGGLEIPANGSVELKPGSYHIMLMQLKHDLVAGDQITVTLTFESGTTFEVVVPVKQT